ncbi:MAG: amidohydrolase family protein [Rhodothermales bacterium]
MTQPLFRKDLATPPYGLFDVHANVGFSDREDLSFGRLSGEDFLDLMETSGVARACVFPPLMARYRQANERLADWAATTDGRVLPFARLGGRRGPRPLRRSWQVRETLGAFFKRQPSDAVDLARYAGVKLIPHLSGLPSRGILARISELRLPVLVHAGVPSPPAWIERALVDRLRGPVILAHLGAFPCDAVGLRAAVELAQRHAHVYLDTSGAWMAGFITYAAEHVPEKLLFGSDAPLAHPLVAWHHVASVVRDEHILERIGRGNACEGFGWELDVRARTPARIQPD